MLSQSLLYLQHTWLQQDNTVWRFFTDFHVHATLAWNHQLFQRAYWFDVHVIVYRANMITHKRITKFFLSIHSVRKESSRRTSSQLIIPFYKRHSSIDYSFHVALTNTHFSLLFMKKHIAHKIHHQIPEFQPSMFILYLVNVNVF